MSKRRSSARRDSRESRSPAAAPAAPRRPRPVWLDRVLRHGLWITLAAALVTHLVQFLCVRANDPFFAQTFKGFDMHTYWTWAQKIVGGDYLGKEFSHGQPFYYGPLYSYYLAAVFKTVGESHLAVHLLQALWGLFPPVLLFLVARRLFGSGPALATGLLAAFCAPVLFYEQLLLMEGLLVLIHAGVLWTLVRGQGGARGAWAWAAAAGALSAIACWGRGNFLLAIPLLGLAWIVAPTVMGWSPPATAAADDPADPAGESAEGDESKTGGTPPHESGQRGQSASARTAESAPSSLAPSQLKKWRRSRGILCAAAYGLGAAVFLAVPLARNIHVAKKAVLTTSNGPILFYIGNAHDSLGIFSYPASYDALVKQYPSQYDVPWKKELLRDMASHPGAFISLLVKKTWMFWNSYDVADNVSYYLNQRFSWLFRLSPVYWGALVPLALLGVWHARRMWRSQLFLYVYAVGFALSIILVFVVGRYRLQEVLPMLVWAGAATAAVLGEAWNRRWNSVATQGLVVAAGVGILWPAWSPAARLNTPHSLPESMRAEVQLVRPNDYNTVAIAYSKLDRNAEARAVLEEAVRAYPWYDAAIARLASIYTEGGEPERAITMLQNSLRLLGGNQGLLLQLADAQLRAGKLDDARATLEAIVRADPKNVQAQALLARLPQKSSTPRQ